MRILFLHPNFPGQFKLLARELSSRPEHQLAAIGHGERSPEFVTNIQYLFYRTFTGRPELVFPPIQTAAEHLRRGRSVADLMLKLRNGGFQPDRILAHPGWGDATFAKDIFPAAHLTVYMEFYYRSENSDIDFDPEFPPAIVDLPFTRVRNVTNLLAFAESDEAITPTAWQASLFPPRLRSQITVQHEGIDCDVATPAPSTFDLPSGQTLSRNDEVVTYVARSLEPYRGFHTFMRSLPKLLRVRKNVHVVIVGGDGVSYGRQPAGGLSWKSVLLKELDDSLDMSRVHFVDRIPYKSLIALFNVSSVHVYLTYPFVLSWSLLEAMACGCAVVASDTGPVREVIDHQRNGLLVDFFKSDELAERVAQLLRNAALRKQMGENARSFIVDHYDFRTRALPRFKGLLGLT